jgi:hypothetical protein
MQPMDSVFFDRLEHAKDADRVVFIGYDPLEDAAAKMLANSIRQNTREDIKIIPIIRDELLAYSRFMRPIDPNGSTQFSITRFLVPFLMNYSGTGIFFDCDMLITRDIKEMFDLADPSFAVQVPKHDYVPKTPDKMGGLPQTSYPKKQWSAVVIYNCAHESNKALTPKVVTNAEPKFLHRFEWLKEEEIGGIPLEYNFLVGEEDMPDTLPFNIHHTLGAPIFRDCQQVDYADHWKAEFNSTFGRAFKDTDIIN